MAKKKSKAKKRPVGKSKRKVAKKKAVKKKAKSSSKAKSVAKKAGQNPLAKKVKAKSATRLRRKAAKKVARKKSRPSPRSVAGRSLLPPVSEPRADDGKQKPMFEPSAPFNVETSGVVIRGPRGPVRRVSARAGAARPDYWGNTRAVRARGSIRT